MTLARSRCKRPVQEHVGGGRQVRAAQAKKRPYTIVFVGVNGVGKSTNLSKIAYWLGQNDVKVCALLLFSSTHPPDHHQAHMFTLCLHRCYHHVLRVGLSLRDVRSKGQTDAWSCAAIQSSDQTLATCREWLSVLRTLAREDIMQTLLHTLRLLSESSSSTVKVTGGT